MTEQQIENSILTWLNYQYQCFAFKMNLKGTWNPKVKAFMKAPTWVPKGAADIIFIFQDPNTHLGIFGALEIKTPSAYKKFHKNPGEHELRQMAFLKTIKNKGGIAEVVCSLAQVQEIITNHIKSKG